MFDQRVDRSYKWEAGYGTDDDCLSYKDLIILKVESNINNGYAWVDIDPTVPKVGQGYAYNISGSPSWDDFFAVSIETANNLTAGVKKVRNTFVKAVLGWDW